VAYLQLGHDSKAYQNPNYAELVGRMIRWAANRPSCVSRTTTLSMPSLARMTGDPATSLAFRPAEKGYYGFDTGVFRGKMRLDGHSQGICSLIHAPTGIEMAKSPGLLSYYRLLVTNGRYGHSARDWPTEQKLLSDGALEVSFPPGIDHPLRMTGVFRWKTPNSLDLETIVTPQRDMPRMEVFVSSYLTKGFDALVYLAGSPSHQDGAALVRTDVNPLVDGTWLMFARDRAAAERIFDGRWDYPPNPVHWSVPRWLGAPVVLRRDAASRLTVLWMAPPDDCFAVAMPYNKVPPDGIAGHASLYLSLFGQDLKAGQTARARSRMVIDRDLTDQRAVELYGEYLKECQTPRKQ
jgi:hypothetical protein